MARRKGSRTSFQDKWRLPPAAGALFLKIFLGMAIGAGGGVWAYTRIHQALTHSPYFEVKAVDIDASLSFINPRDLESVQGRNLFTVNLNDLQRRLAYKYPQVTQLKIVKRFPDRILILAKRRLPFAQAVVKNRTLTLDEKGVVLATGGTPQKELTLISGLPAQGSVSLGMPLRGEELRIALRIIAEFRAEPALAAHRLTKIDTANLLQIDCYLSSPLKVIIDRQDIGRKVKLLGLVLSQKDLDWERVKYIDLRFQEPIIGRK